MRIVSVLVLLVGIGVFVAAILVGPRPAPSDRGPPVSSSVSVDDSVEKATISTGQAVALADHAVASGYTLFEYTADW